MLSGNSVKLLFAKPNISSVTGVIIGVLVKIYRQEKAIQTKSE